MNKNVILVAVNIRNFKDMNNYTWGEVAEMFTLTQKGVYNIVNGKYLPHIRTLERIAFAMGFTLEEVLYENLCDKF